MNLYMTEHYKIKKNIKRFIRSERLMLNDETWDFWPPEETNSIQGQRLGWIAQSFRVIEFY